MNNTFLLRLDDNDLSKILDDLREREESWRIIADFFRSSQTRDDSFAIEERSGEYEATQTALFYSRIIRDLEDQREHPPASERETYLQGKADGQDNLIIRLLDNWRRLQQLDSSELPSRLPELKDEICDD